MLQLLARGFEFPLSVILSWPKPNYIDPARRGPELYIVNGIWLFIATVCVGARLYTRIYIRNWFGLDDAFIVLAIIAAYGVAACVLLGFHMYAWDRHIWDMPLLLVTPSGKVLYASRILWAVASTSVRCSVVALYYRLLDHTGLRKYRWILHVNSVFIALLFLAQEGTAILACLPPKAMWSWPQMTNAKCLDNGAAEITGAILNTISEFVVACLPIPLVVSLKMTRAQRYGVVSVLCLGFIVVACGCVRTYYLWMSVSTFDPSWYAGPHWICSEVEIDMAMICACAPVLKPMLSRLLTRGPAAARKPNLNESGHQVGSDSNQRARSLFSKKLSDDSGNLNSFGTRSSLLQYKTVDLEGIANDGFGYTVVITGNSEMRIKRKRSRLMKLRQTDSEESLEQGKSVIQAPRRALSSRGSGAKRHKANEILDIDDKYDTDIITRKSFEFRESYHESNDRTWDMRNPYKGRVSSTEKDIEKGGSLSPSRGAEWAHLGGNPRRTPTPVLGKKDSKNSFDQQHPQTATTARLARHNSENDRTSNRRLTTKDFEKDRIEMNSSPQIMFPQRSFPRIVQAQRMNTPSPPPLSNHFGGKLSPIVQPLNSSQWWASGHAQPHLERISPVSALSSNSTEKPPTVVEESPWSGPLEAVIASAWDQGRAESYNSSISVKDGSRMSLGNRTESVQEGMASEDGESFTLPIEKPPSWGPAGPDWSRVRPGSANLPRTSNVPISWVGTRPGTAF